MENDQFKLPENAQRELKPGEEYEPILSKNKSIRKSRYGRCASAC